MSFLTHSPFLKALGWALLNSLWQFGAIWLLFVLLINTRKNISPAIKHGLALVLMSAGFLWFAAGLSIEYLSYSGPAVSGASLYNFQNLYSYSIIYRSVQIFLENNLSYLSVIYLLIVAGFFIRFFRFFYYSHSVKTYGLSKLRAELRLYVQQLAQQLDITRKVQVWVSEYIDTPMVMGFIKPVILIPLACINQLSVQQIEAVLLHELAHIKRNDYLVNLYIATSEILFFFNPFARLLIKSIKQEREKSCDDWVLQFRFDPHQYASALLALEQSRSSMYSLAIAATGANKNLLLQRVQRIMGIKNTKQDSGFKLLANMLTIALLTFIALVNPGNIVVKKIENTFLASSARDVSAEIKNRILDDSNILPADELIEKPMQRKSKKDKLAVVPSADKNDDDENSFVLPVSDIEGEDNGTTGITLLNSVKTETKDFSIKEKELPPAPELPQAPNEFPFVPNSSFSYYSIEDSNLAKLRSAVSQDHSARQSLVQAQKAIDKINWDKIAKNQNINKSALLKLRKEIQGSLKDLNWQQINKEAKDSLNKEVIENMRSSIKQDVENIKTYKAIQQQYETIKTELYHQQEKLRQGINIELNEIQNKVQKRKVKVIVYI